MSTLLPRYSIRRMLVMTTVCAVFFLILSLAVRGHLWAAAVSIAVGSGILVVIVGAILFTVAWFVSLVVQTLRPRRKAESPFAQFRPPPQLITPETVD